MSSLGPRQIAIHAGLYAATCLTTYLAGGAIYAATLMAILTCHEMGHYVVARRYGLEVSLPYFIPLPPMISLGTLGAVIQMKQPTQDRNALIDVGAAGPIAGLVVALPALAIGLTQSYLAPPGPDQVMEGNSIAYALFKRVVIGRWLPGGGTDVDLHPMAFAAWVGLLVTMINLIPIGQLDGGHVMRAWLDERHERISAILHRALPLVALASGGVLFAMASSHGAGVLSAIGYAGYGAMPWLVWTLALYGMRQLNDGQYHPPVSGPPLSPARRRLAIAMLIVFVLLFIPVPMRPPL